MPELPEVQTTVNGLEQVLPGLHIISVWSDYPNGNHVGKANIKDKRYLAEFSKKVRGRTFKNVTRQGKNILMHLEGGETILVHMKMTGHLMYGKYKQEKSVWKAAKAGPLADPFNQFIHLALSLSDGNTLVLSDMRKFAKVLFYETERAAEHADLGKLGPDPLAKDFTYSIFKTQLLKKPHWKIKAALLDQELIAGIGNIYSDEILWQGGVHPETPVQKIPEKNLREMFAATKEVLEKSIGMGGDSLSDYRNAFGEKGGFQKCHNAYRQTGKACTKKGCTGTIARLLVGARSAHYCTVHQPKM